MREQKQKIMVYMPVWLIAAIKRVAEYEACKTAKALKKVNPFARYPYKRKFYHTTTWKNTGIKVEQGRMRSSVDTQHVARASENPQPLSRPLVRRLIGQEESPVLSPGECQVCSSIPTRMINGSHMI